MDHRKMFFVEPGAKVHLAKVDPFYTGEHELHKTAGPEIRKHVERMDKLQYLLCADAKQSPLVVLQALDAAWQGRRDPADLHRHESAGNICGRIQTADQGRTGA